MAGREFLGGVVMSSPVIKLVACIAPDPAYIGTSTFCPRPLDSLSKSAAEIANDAVNAVP